MLVIQNQLVKLYRMGTKKYIFERKIFFPKKKFVKFLENFGIKKFLRRWLDRIKVANL